MSILRRDEIITRWNLIPVVHPVSVLLGMGISRRNASPWNRERDPVDASTHAHISMGVSYLGTSTSAGKGEHPRLIQRGINVWPFWEGHAPARPQTARLWTQAQRIASLPSRPLMGRGEVESWLKHGDDVFSQPPFVSDETGFCVFRGKKKTYDDMIELQPSASLGTLRVVVFGCGDRECREWVKPPREPHAIQTVRSCNRYATCLTCSSSLSGSSLPISRFSRSPRPYPSHPHAPILPISTANPITFDHRLAGGWG